MPDVQQVEVVLANNDRVTVRVGDVFLKIDADQSRTEVEVEAMAIAPVPTPEVLWRNPPALAPAAVPGKVLGCLGERSTASPAAWAAAGAAIRTLHDAPLPPWPRKSLDELASRLAGECDWLVANEVLPADVVRRNRHLAEAALRPGHRYSRTATCTSNMYSSMMARSQASWIGPRPQGHPPGFFSCALVRP